MELLNGSLSANKQSSSISDSGLIDVLDLGEQIANEKVTRNQFVRDVLEYTRDFACSETIASREQWFFYTLQQIMQQEFGLEENFKKYFDFLKGNSCKNIENTSISEQLNYEQSESQIKTIQSIEKEVLVMAAISDKLDNIQKDINEKLSSVGERLAALETTIKHANLSSINDRLVQFETKAGERFNTITSRLDKIDSKQTRNSDKWFQIIGGLAIALVAAVATAYFTCVFGK
jgi:DNA repair ATPase RecN